MHGLYEQELVETIKSNRWGQFLDSFLTKDESYAPFLRHTVVRSTAFESLFCLGAARTKKTFKRGTSPKFFISSVYFFSQNKKDDVAREHIVKMEKFSSSKVLPLVNSQRGLF